MMYTLSERMDIGRQVYNHELSVLEAQSKFRVCRSAVQKYVTDYKRANGYPVKTNPITKIEKNKTCNDLDLDTYQAMSKDELIRELILAKANELRAKKGYEVKGDGPNKVFNSLNNKSLK